VLLPPFLPPLSPTRDYRHSRPSLSSDHRHACTQLHLHSPPQPGCTLPVSGSGALHGCVCCLNGGRWHREERCGARLRRWRRDVRSRQASRRWRLESVRHLHRTKSIFLYRKGDNLRISILTHPRLSSRTTY
jgi:hypothetical protein